MRKTNLTETLLSTANLSGANLAEANLRDAKAMGADFTGAKLENSDLSGTQFSGTPLPQVALAVMSEELPVTTAEMSSVVLVAKGLTQSQLDSAHADPSNPPKLDGVIDADTGKQLVWNGKPPKDQA